MKNISLNLLENNTGQISGVNQNPRDLNNKGFDLAIESIKSFPEMLELRSLVVVPHKNKYVVIGGNQRLHALRHLEYAEAPCIIADKLTVAQINEFIIKDNVQYGDWNFDLLANEWETELLVEWGLDLPVEAIIEGMPKDLSDKISYAFKLEIDCKNEETLQSLYDEMKNRGLECRILTL